MTQILNERRPGESVDDAIDRMRRELRLLGFCVVKEIARLRDDSPSTGLRAMDCPLCNQRLLYSTAGNGHFWARCSSPSCINVTE